MELRMALFFKPRVVLRRAAHPGVGYRQILLLVIDVSLNKWFGSSENNGTRKSL